MPGVEAGSTSVRKQEVVERCENDGDLLAHLLIRPCSSCPTSKIPNFKSYIRERKQSFFTYLTCIQVYRGLYLNPKSV